MSRADALARRGAALALLAFALASCTLSGRIDFVDHTGLGFEVDIGSGTLQIPPSGTAPHGVNYSGREVAFVIRQGRCRHIYDVPSSDKLLQLPRHPGGMIVFQLEPDMRLHLMPDDSEKPVDPATLASLQRAGFPLAPVFSRCDEPAAG